MTCSRRSQRSAHLRGASRRSLPAGARARRRPRLRAEVRGSTRKLYKQKGTGARVTARFAPAVRRWRQGARSAAARLLVPSAAQDALGRARERALAQARRRPADRGGATFSSARSRPRRLATVLEVARGRASSLIVDADANENLAHQRRNLASNHQFLPPEGVNVYDLLRHEHLILTKDAATQPSQKRLQRERLRSTMRAEDIIKRPLMLTEKGNRAARGRRTSTCSRSSAARTRSQIRGAVEALWKVSVLKVHTLDRARRKRRMGRGHAKTQNWKKAIVSLKAGRHASTSSKEPESWRSNASNPRRPRAATSRPSASSELSKDRPERKLLDVHKTHRLAATTRVASRRASAAAVTSSATASSTWKRNKIGVPAQRRAHPVRSEPHARASRSSTTLDGEKRYILAPDGLKVGDTGALVAQGRHQARQLPAAALHPGGHDDARRSRLKIGKGAQLVRSAGTAAQLMAKEGEYAQVRLPSGEVRLVHLECRATIGQVSNLAARAHVARQSRPHPLARSSPAQPRRHA